MTTRNMAFLSLASKIPSCEIATKLVYCDWDVIISACYTNKNQCNYKKKKKIEKWEYSKEKYINYFPHHSLLQKKNVPTV